MCLKVDKVYSFNGILNNKTNEQKLNKRGISLKKNSMITSTLK